MSILIKGMEKPKDCGICPFEFDGWPDEWEMHCKLLDRQVGYFGKKLNMPQNCPLIEVPTPHGRLIDADRLKRQVEGRLWKARDKFVELIDNAPTIIEAEEGEEE